VHVAPRTGAYDPRISTTIPLTDTADNNDDHIYADHRINATVRWVPRQTSAIIRPRHTAIISSLDRRGGQRTGYPSAIDSSRRPHRRTPHDALSRRTRPTRRHPRHPINNGSVRGIAAWPGARYVRVTRRRRGACAEAVAGSRTRGARRRNQLRAAGSTRATGPGQGRAYPECSAPVLSQLDGVLRGQPNRRAMPWPGRLDGRLTMRQAAGSLTVRPATTLRPSGAGPVSSSDGGLSTGRVDQRRS
jgi:hypothetical protein